jgi:hypothetical protein
VVAESMVGGGGGSPFLVGPVMCGGFGVGVTIKRIQ